jgi:hypothetical protein
MELVVIWPFKEEGERLIVLLQFDEGNHYVKVLL